MTPPGERGSIIASFLKVRPNIANLSDAQLASLKRGIAAMKALPSADPRSWQFQANIHGTNDPATSPLFNQCEHGTLRFLAWHRGYLYYFERILRELSDDPALMLPYWDWTADPVLPVAFRMPADDGNPLFDSTRNLNSGAALPATIVVDDLDSALKQIAFPLSGSLGFSPSLESSPHGAVHVQIGGNMSSVPTAANDPIFWLHHCNIDRLWDRWLSLAGGRVNPSDTAFLDKTYSLPDEQGNVVPWKIRDIISSTALGYCYDNVAVPPALAVAFGESVKKPAPIRVATTLKAEEATGAKAKPLGLEPVTEKLPIGPEHRNTLRNAIEAPGPAAPGKILLQIEGLSAKEVPNYVYAVYLNLGPKEVAEDKRKPHYVGTVNFFGKVHRKADDHAAGKTFTATFDVTAVVARLRQAGLWNPEAVSVTLRPLTPVPPPGQEADLRKRIEKSAQKSGASYQGFSLVVVP
jgi:hypothetical protein